MSLKEKVRKNPKPTYVREQDLVQVIIDLLTIVIKLPRTGGYYQAL